MNYKFLAIEELVEFSNRFPQYSLCEIIFTILKSTGKSKEISWLYELTDRELLTAIENATKKEEE